MDEPKRKLVVLLCMHRSGSSLTANILHKLGMSLGPFELIAAAPSNPYGHFESIPFHSLNRRIQEWAYGFADDVPDDPRVLARFLQERAAWPTDRALPEEWVDEAERITRVLIESGPVSGFKDPRTVLVWPFWRKVFERIENVQIVAASLLRSPHEIAMSLCTRSRGNMPYWNALDVVGVHLDRMKVVADEQAATSHVVRFGTASFWDDTKQLAEACGLPWNDAIVRSVYDPSCVHHQPAAVAHASQVTLNALGSDAWADVDTAANAERLAADARKYESTTHSQLTSTRNELGKTIVQLRQAEHAFNEANAQVNEQGLKCVLMEREVTATQQALAESEKGFQLARTCLEQTEKHLARVMETLVSNQERRVQAEQMLAHTQGVLAFTEQALAESQRRVADAHDHQERLLTSFQQTYQTAQADHDQDRRRWQADRARAEEVRQADRARGEEVHNQLVELQETMVRKEQQLVRSLEREEKRWLENVALRRRIDKFESNALIGVAVKGRRQIKQFWLRLRHTGPNGEPRSTRVDRPM
ncbi:hypothetical protein [Paludisphaera mucosa]|uniref:Chromosome partition protein Smc n=1 Tax=Paludisphaera mucosa TaxID=3030827 RepID=A0ABT6F6Q1_9BACT|nr:hypothetical protein [Paludisphaera mucosa]MDG3003070.1 hypothetical protein [Paludisphaera mucosa]